MRIIFIMFLLSLELNADACTAGQWTCSNGDCIADRRRCDNLPDCSDASDEQNCAFLTNCPEGLESCVLPNGSITCVDKASGCSCGSLPVIENGTAVLRDNTSLEFVADLLCNEGFEASKSIIKCKIFGHWELASCIDVGSASSANACTKKMKNCSTDTTFIIVIVVLVVVVVVLLSLLIVFCYKKHMHRTGNGAV